MKAPRIILCIAVLMTLLLSACGNGDNDDKSQKEKPSATPELILPTDNAVNWTTEKVRLTADNFYIVANGKLFLGDAESMTIGGDPGSETYTTLELKWAENDVEMRLHMYFEVVDGQWQASEIRMYNGRPQGEWIIFEGPIFTTPQGQSYTVLSFGRQNNERVLAFTNLELQAFTNQE